MSANEYARTILAALKPLLYGRGYRRKGQTFVARQEDVLLLINLQRSTSSTHERLIVTLNLGVYSLPLAHILGTPDEIGSMWNCHWQQRIGHCLPENEDRWWLVATEAEATQVAQALAEALEQYGLPALEQVASTDRLYALYNSPKNLDRWLSYVAVS